MKKFFSRKISLPAFILVLAVLTLSFSAIFYYFANTVYDYRLNIPEVGQGVFVSEYGSQPALSNPTFFNKVRENFIEQKTSFIEADLSLMKLRLYESGKIIKEVPILTKGKEGSWWETPAGLYKIESKEKNHFSSFGKVYQPWSLQFQGNFFIHGWPYYPDGRPVKSDYSGGCIRLSSEDAKAIFDLVKLGTPVLVYEKDFGESDGFEYKRKPPEVSAKNVFIADLKNNYVFFKKEENEIRPIASLAKLLTALVAVEYINLDKEIVIKQNMITPTSYPRLRAGESVRAFDLLYPLLLESSNEAAEALTSYLGRDRFIEIMNKKAKSLGMVSARLVDPAGRGDENIATSQDLFNLAKYLYANRSFVLKITTGKLNYSAYGPPVFVGLGNFNPLHDRKDFVGGKIGKTAAAGETLLEIFEMEIQDTKRPIAVILLGSEASDADAQKILDYIKANF
ncbi:MAG: L,D-transpeptidase family protein [Candidatus Magasanikbacteria bacterium]|nr:L,D-transpeptidase family protein [Candidatus Magasanikbacteria bacterium]